MNKICWLCGNSDDLASYMSGSEIVHLCRSKMRCEGVLSMKRSTAHALRTGGRGHMITQAPPEPDHRQVSSGD